MPVWGYFFWVGCYLVGAIPFGYLVARRAGIDIFQHGSGNIGATNVGRVLGRKLGFLVFALDFLKGALPVALALALKQSADGWFEVGAGLSTILGHLFPVFLKFRGGKGVATGAGVVAVLLPLPGLIALLVWLVLASSFCMVSLASIGAAAVLVGVQLLRSSDFADPRTLFSIAAGLLVVVRHRTNLGRILKGTENRLPESAMLLGLRGVLHRYALGLWFGTSIFFTFVVGLTLFGTFEAIGERPAGERPGWLPLPAAFAWQDEHINGPKEQGVRVAGQAVGPMFHWYFLLQGICGVVALVTALPDRARRWRLGILALALVAVLIGWPLERKVSELRGPRNEATDAYLQAEAKTTELTHAMKAARSEFGRWHLYSLALNLATVLLVSVGLALARDERPAVV